MIKSRVNSFGQSFVDAALGVCESIKPESVRKRDLQYRDHLRTEMITFFDAYKLWNDETFKAVHSIFKSTPDSLSVYHVENNLKPHIAVSFIHPSSLYPTLQNQPFMSIQMKYPESLKPVDDLIPDAMGFRFNTQDLTFRAINQSTGEDITYPLRMLAQQARIFLQKADLAEKATTPPRTSLRQRIFSREL